MTDRLFPAMRRSDLPDAVNSIVRDIEAIDWSATAVGAIADWPAAYIATARMMLGSPMPMVMLMGPTGVLVYNHAYAMFAGDRHPSALGKDVAVAWPEIADFNLSILKRVLAGETVLLPEQQLTLNRSGRFEEVWLDLQYSPVYGEDGVPIAEFALFTDATPRVLNRRALERSEESLSFASAASGMIGVWDWDVTADQVRSDARFANMFGVQPDIAARGAPIGMFVDGVHPADRAGLQTAIDDALARRGDLRCEYRLLARDGSITWVLALGRVSEDNDGTLRLPGVVLDITEQKQAAQALAESEAQFRALADSMPQMVWSTRPDGFHDYYNARWYEFTGVPPGSTDGEGWNDMFHPDDQARAWSQWRHSLETGDPYQIEYRLKHHSGRYRWTLGRALPIRDADGAIMRWFGTCTDIDDAKRAAEEREIVAQELSHRIKNIFSVLAGIVALSARTYPEMSSFAKQLRERIIALGHAHEFVRPHSQASRAKYPSTSLHGLVRQLLAAYETDGASVEIEGPDAVIDDGAATPLALIFHELGTNAAKYGAFAAADGSLKITTALDGSTYRLEWKERGVAIAPALSAAKSGFGSRLIQLSVSGQLGGEIKQEWEADGLRLTLLMPLAALSRSAKLLSAQAE